MKRKLWVIIIPLALILVVILLVPKGTLELSDPQKDTIEYLGYPAQFVISYIPAISEENTVLQRTEIWYYPKLDIKITFVAGKIFSTENFAETQYDLFPITKLQPQNFHYDSNPKSYLNKSPSKIDLVGDIPEYETYASEEAYYVMENNKLTYFQTFGLLFEDE